MKTVERSGAQGDVLFRRVERIPEGCQPLPRSGPLIVAHSETGHHHVIASPDVVLLRTENPLLCYLQLEGAFADVEHLRPYDTHETLRLLGAAGTTTFFEMRRQREYVPSTPENSDAERKRWRQVID